MPHQPFFPTVLIVDDDPALTTYLRQMFHTETAVGVVVANSLDEGRRLLETAEIHIDGVITDLFFDAGTDDPENHLFNGLHLLELSSRLRPATRRYVTSFFAEHADYRHRPEAADIPAEHWFQKAWYRPGADERPPWQEIERDLIKARLASDEQAQQRLHSLGLGRLENLDAVSVAVQSLRLPTRTYLQDMGVYGLRVQRPIEVVCFWDPDGTVWASALRLGLLTDGMGTTVDEAIESLQEIIADTKRRLDEEPPENLLGLAEEAKRQLDLYLQEAK